MGCCGSKKEADEDEPKKFSWEDRPRLDPKLYTIDGIEGRTVVREPGSINGQPFVIQNCKNARIFLLDDINTITVDDCSACQIVIGPTQGSVFLRDCNSCQLVVSCQQFRTRDCSKLDIFLLCSTQPIIEASSKMRFGCYQLEYEGLLQQMEKSGLSVFNNNWYNIHDFTPVTEAKNWTLLPENVSLSDVINLDLQPSEASEEGNGGALLATDQSAAESSLLLSQTNLSVRAGSSVVPLTRGSRKQNSNESCFLLVFHSKNSKEIALRMIRELSTVDLVQTKQVNLSPDETRRLVSDGNSATYTALARQGPAIGLEFSGDRCVESCKEVLKSLEPTDAAVYSSPDSRSAQREIELFYNFCDMRMSA